MTSSSYVAIVDPRYTPLDARVTLSASDPGAWYDTFPELHSDDHFSHETRTASEALLGWLTAGIDVYVTRYTEDSTVHAAYVRPVTLADGLETIDA